jgi:very-short-patch-repair endonuclease/predicted transcriptional regulator of viral defense system
MPELWSSDPNSSGQTCRVRVDAQIAALADRQHGVVSRRQLAALGATSSMIDTRIGRGSLVPLHRGVYAVGHRRLRREGFWLAAVLATGPGAALSHRDAAALHGLRSAHDGRIDVTTTLRRRVKQAGIAIHNTAALSPLDVITIDAIPVTSIARTLADLAAVVPDDQLAKALSEAERRNVLDVTAIEAVMERTRHRPGPGHANLRAALDEHRRRGAQLTRSELEDRFRALLDRHGIAAPRMNAHLHGYEVDALWPTHRLVVELDGYAFHRDRRAFQRDRDKANALTAAGYTVLRFTHDDILRRPARTAAHLRALLAT